MAINEGCLREIEDSSSIDISGGRPSIVENKAKSFFGVVQYHS
jgi:hypothetical protein